MTDDPFEFDEDDAVPEMATGPVAPPAYLAGLNDSQRRAVESLDGPLLVLAGAGTGKTRVLTTRLAHLLLSRAGAPDYIHPHNILAVTFTNKAAREMRERVAEILGRPVEGWWLGTFHALGARILRRHAEAVGLAQNFTILDTDDQLRLLKQVMDDAGIDAKKWPARQLAGVIGRWKDKGLAPDKVNEPDGFADGRSVALYRAYQERLRTLNACDFGDLLLHCLTLFQSDPAVLAQYRRWFRYILVDEYQDTNIAQYLWLRLLAMEHRNICCVGDDDQSIYSWRGAEVGNILRFEQDFDGAQVVRLEQNYRSNQHILAAASGLIAHNADRLGKTLWTDREGGDAVRIKGVWDGEAEARMVGEDIEALQRDQVALSQVAVLVRAGFQTREFEERFITLGLPYRVIGGPRFYERQEIRDAIAYLRLVESDADGLAFERVVNVPKRGLGPASLKVINEVARHQHCSLMGAARLLVETEDIKPKARAALAGFIVAIDAARRVRDTRGHVAAAQAVLDESGYTDHWRRSKEIDAPGRLENLKELVGALGEFDTLTGFLEHISLVMDNAQAEESNKVTVMTLHAAKGLEFDHVFLPGWEEGVFPHQRAMDEGGLKGLEEERRLAYVGLTRARHRATVSHAANRRVYNQWQSALPSRFIDELPDEHTLRSADSGLFPDQPPGYSGTSWGAGSGEFGNRRARPQVIEATSWREEPSYSVAEGGRYRPGERVLHKKFGQGRVVTVDGNKLEIDFDAAGRKKVVESFIFPVDD